MMFLGYFRKTDSEPIRGRGGGLSEKRRFPSMHSEIEKAPDLVLVRSERLAPQPKLKPRSSAILRI